MESHFGEQALISRVHHNCVMTKHPRYGSLTGWHYDIRYWSFEHADLIPVWLALGAEEIDNGGLRLVPASHRVAFDSDQYDEAKFFRADRADNAKIIGTSDSPRLARSARGHSSSSQPLRLDGDCRGAIVCTRGCRGYLDRCF